MYCWWQVYLMITRGQYVGDVFCGPFGEVTLLISGSMCLCEWCVARLLLWKGYQKDKCNDNEIGILGLTYVNR